MTSRNPMETSINKHETLIGSKAEKASGTVPQMQEELQEEGHQG